MVAGRARRAAVRLARAGDLREVGVERMGSCCHDKI